MCGSSVRERPRGRLPTDGPGAPRNKTQARDAVSCHHRLVTVATTAEPDPRISPKAAGSEEIDPLSETGAHGTVARFEMTYSAPTGRRTKFGPPLRQRIPSALYLLAALGLGAVVLYGYTTAPTDSRLFVWLVEGDRDRVLSASVLASIVVVSALATTLRTHMRGVLVGDEWIEARYLLAFGIPRARRWAWPEVTRVVLDDVSVGLELWDGSFHRLPEVSAARELAGRMASEARRRRIDVTELDRAIRR